LINIKYNIDLLAPFFKAASEAARRKGRYPLYSNYKHRTEGASNIDYRHSIRCSGATTSRNAYIKSPNTHIHGLSGASQALLLLDRGKTDDQGEPTSVR
jgi:hypothetical protein